MLKGRALEGIIALTDLLFLFLFMIVTLLRQFKSFVLLKVNLNALVLFLSTLIGVNNVLQVRGRKIAVRIVFLHNVSTEYLICQYARLWVIPLRFYFGAAQTSQKAAKFSVLCLTQIITPTLMV